MTASQPHTRQSTSPFTRRRFLASTAATGATGLMAGCLDSITGGGASGGGNEITVVTGQSDPNSIENWEAAGAEYEEETGTTVNFEFLGVEEANQTILQRLQAGNPPEIGQRTLGFFAQFLGGDVLYPVDDPVNDIHNEIGEVGDHLYLFNPDSGERVVFADFIALTTFSVRTDYIEQAGHTFPQNPQDHHNLSWDTFRNYVRDIDEQVDGVRGITASRGESASAMFDAQLVLWGHGVDIWNGDNVDNIELTMDQGQQRQRTIQALEDWAEFANWSTDARGISWGTKFDTFGSGQVGSTVYSAGRTLAATQEYDPEGDQYVMPMASPKTSNGGRSDGANGQAGSNSMGIFKDSANPDAAAEFLKWYYTSDHYLNFVVSVPYHSVPPYPDLAGDAYINHPNIQDYSHIAESQQVLLEQSAPREVTPEGGFNPLGGMDYDFTWTPRMFEKVIDEGMDPGEAIDQTCAEIRQVAEEEGHSA